jgi:hypothetical protein
MIIVRLLSPEPFVGLAPQSLPGRGSRHCYGIISLIDPWEGFAINPPRSGWRRARASPLRQKDTKGSIPGTDQKEHERCLLDAVHCFRHLDTATIEDCRDDVGDMMILISDLSTRLDPFRPRNDKWITTAAVVGVKA